MESDAGSTAALDRYNGDFGYFPTLFGYRQNGLAVRTRERQGGDAYSTLPKSDISSGCTTGQYSLMNFKISQHQQLAITFLRCDQSRMFAGDPLQGIYS